MNYQWYVEDIDFMYLSKHFCPKCNVELQKIRCRKIVKSNSKEARETSVFGIQLHFPGSTTEVVYNELKCPVCSFQASEKEMKRIENDSLNI